MQKEKSTWEAFPFIKPELQAQKNPTILAFSCYFHDSSACVLKDGKIIAAADEERFSRKKHDADFPKQSIQFCIDAVKHPIDIVVFYENPDVKWKRIQEILTKNPPSLKTYEKIKDLWENLKSKDKIQKVFQEETGLDNSIIFLDHHLCHAASSYFMSGFEEAVVVTIDGVGERITTAYGTAKGKHIQFQECINYPHSIGLLYTALTVFLGFKANDHEYKVMGLAPYGDMNKKTNPYFSKLKKIITINKDGSFFLNMKYFGHEDFDSLPYTQALIDLLEMDPLSRGAAISQQYKDLAAALQLITEEVVLNLLCYVHKKTGIDQLCYSGGVALNSVLNGKILSQTPFKKLFIQPSAGDSGTVIGAAKYIQSIVEEENHVEHMTHAYYGPEYSTEEIKKFLNTQKITYKTFNSNENLLREVAWLLKEKAVIGWFQGKMEWGPRALGNRSILANPMFNDMRDILNEKVKHRELFRPFAPVICVDDANKFFECDEPVPEPTDYMLMVYPIIKQNRSKIPAVTHVDGSGRLQTIREEQNYLYYHLIKKFGEITGVPILVNTSFNIRGEPIVCSPFDAYRCMMGTEIDYLVMDHFLIKRDDNLKDSWVPVIND